MSNRPLLSPDELRVLYVRAIQENTRLFARVRVLEEALRAVIITEPSGNRRCKLCGCCVDRFEHMTEACEVAAALAPTKTEGME